MKLLMSICCHLNLSCPSRLGAVMLQRNLLALYFVRPLTIGGISAAS